MFKKRLNGFKKKSKLRRSTIVFLVVSYPGRSRTIERDSFCPSLNFKSICRPRLLCFRRSGRLLAKGFRKGNLYFLSASVGQAHHTRVSSSFIANGSTPSGLGLGCTCSLADDLIGLSSVVKLGSSDQIGLASIGFLSIQQLQPTEW